MRRRRSHIGETFLYGIVGIVAIIIAIGQFLLEHIWIVAIVVLIPLAIFLIVQIAKSNKGVLRRNKPANIFEGKKLVLPKIKVSNEIDREVNELIDFVYADGEPPSEKILSKKNQYNILCQAFALDIDFNKYETMVQQVFENVINKINTFTTITDKDEWYEQMHFAFEHTVKNIIELSANKSASRKCFTAIDNLTGRLVQMNREKFKNLFFRLHEYQFWFVYNEDEEYAQMIDCIKKRLKICHGIKQSDFYKKISGTRDEISYTLYFGEKAGEIVRKQDKQTYRLYLPEDNPDEIAPYEYTQEAATDVDFDYKNYWKDIEKMLKGNDGILQTDFYTKFDWPREILTCALRAAEKDGKIIRKKEGRSYRLYLPEQGK